MELANKKVRDSLTAKRRIVVKVGTQVLTYKNGKLNRKSIRNLVEEIVKLKDEGKEIVLVSSGAIGAGMEALGLSKRPQEVSSLQMCASVGQAKLMSEYGELFEFYGYQIGQVLITRDGLRNRSRKENAKLTLEGLLEANVIPIVNENDTVSSTEICFGDNDILSAMVGRLVQAEALIILSQVEGLYKNFNSKSKRKLGVLNSLAEFDRKHIKDNYNQLARGGMTSKLQAAEIFLGNRRLFVIASGKKKGTLSQLMKGRDVGTVIASR